MYTHSAKYIVIETTIFNTASGIGRGTILGPPILFCVLCQQVNVVLKSICNLK